MGVSLAVEPQVFDVISCLVENRDRLVTRDELIEAVWAGRFVSDTTRDEPDQGGASGTGRQWPGSKTHPHRAQTRLSLCGRCVGKA